MKVSDVFPSKYVKAGDLNGKTVTLTMKKVVIEELGHGNEKERKPVLYFQVATKGMILNATNAHTIAGLYGDEMNDWAGKRIAVYPTQVRAFGKVNDVIRVRPEIPTPLRAATDTGAAELEQNDIDDQEDITDTDGDDSEPPSREVDADTGEILDASAAIDNPFLDPTPYFVHAFNRLTGKPYDLVKWVRTLHDKSEGACTKKQYGYLVSIADELSGGEHSYLLSVLCQSEISKSNMPGEKVTDALLKILRVSSKDDAGNDIANPDYRPDMAEIVKVIAKGQPELVAG